MGVRYSACTREIASGNCPFLAPTKKRRDWVKMAPLVEPKVEQMTNAGMIHAMTPRVRPANVCENAESKSVYHKTA